MQPGAQRDAIEKQIAEYAAQARHYYGRMAELSVKADFLVNYGRTLLNQGDPEAARDVFKSALDLYPEREDIAQYYFTASRKLNDPQGEFDALRALWRQNPGEIAVLYSGGQIAGEAHKGALNLAVEKDLGDSFDALMAEALERNPIDKELYRLRARRAESRGDAMAAAANVGAYLKLNGADPDTLLAGARNAAKLNDAARTRRFCEAVLSGQASEAQKEDARRTLQSIGAAS
jgi:hypothetical protein